MSSTFAFFCFFLIICSAAGKQSCTAGFFFNCGWGGKGFGWGGVMTIKKEKSFIKFFFVGRDI